MNAPWPTTVFTGKELTVVVVCYLLGCFTTGYYWVRWRTGLDIRQFGSGNVGARNVGRLLGPTGFLVTLLLDVAKGALAVDLATYLSVGPEGMIASMLAVVAGHTWPFQLKFQGGKGIATSLGVILAYDPLISLVLLALFVPAWALARSFTLGGLLAFALCPLVLFLWGLGHQEVAAMSLLAILAHIAHRKNLREEFGRLLPDRALKSPSDTFDNDQPS